METVFVGRHSTTLRTRCGARGAHSTLTVIALPVAAHLSLDHRARQPCLRNSRQKHRDSNASIFNEGGYTFLYRHDKRDGRALKRGNRQRREGRLIEFDEFNRWTR